MDNYARARTLLTENMTILQKIADELLIREVLDADQVLRLVKGLPLAEVVPPAPVSVPTNDDTRRETPERSPIVPSLGKPIGQE